MKVGVTGTRHGPKPILAFTIVHFGPESIQMSGGIPIRRNG